MANKPASSRSHPSTARQVSEVSTTIVRQGPLPTPEELFQYDRLIPGAADRIIAMAERDHAARLNLEDMAQRADIRHREALLEAQQFTAKGAFRSDALGQVLGWSVALVCVGGAIYTAMIGANPLVSVALVGLPIASIVKAIRAVKPDKKS